MTVQPVSPGVALAALRLPTERRCAQCGRAFTGRGRATYCSESCKQRAKRQRQRQA